MELRSKGGLFKNYWTEDILAEVVTNLREDHPSWDGGQITAIRDGITGAMSGGRVADFVIDGSYPGPDPKDQHVHAAAMACEASYLMTVDGGFRSSTIELDDLPYEVYKPDDFFVFVDDSWPYIVRRVTAEQDKYWSAIPGSKSLAQALRDVGCPSFAVRVLQHLCQLPAA
ncbi:PIN domain-containing protein [Microlunatus parietis]|uniref:PIN domain-containing protein n=1 Tax=Microlunatus parietis TaxID=682979 RepID=A0A7Y9I925_9ACTN|nr:PIN domain-containing protein [Microlunatus parietis]NYE72579.1 hypothetical protein [Microlunatus parietis]